MILSGLKKGLGQGIKVAQGKSGNADEDLILGRRST
jgi:hypothetical protein